MTCTTTLIKYFKAMCHDWDGSELPYEAESRVPIRVSEIKDILWYVDYLERQIRDTKAGQVRR